MKQIKHVGLDTDIFGDPDDFFALIYALNCPELSVDFIITNDELETKRAKLLKGVLEGMEREDIPIAAGRDLHNKKYFVFNDKVPPVEVRRDYKKLVKEVVREPSEFTYICIGSMANVASIIKDQDLKQMKFIQMGGAINYRKPGKLEHNFKLDIEAAREVVYSETDLKLVLSDTTYRPDILGIDPQSTIYKKLKSTKKNMNSAYTLLSENCTRFYRYFYPQTIMHDPLTVSAAFTNFVKFEKKAVAMNETGNIVVNEGGHGHTVCLSTTADYEGFMKHFGERLFRTRA